MHVDLDGEECFIWQSGLKHEVVVGRPRLRTATQVVSYLALQADHLQVIHLGQAELKPCEKSQGRVKKSDGEKCAVSMMKQQHPSGMISIIIIIWLLRPHIH